MLGALLDIPAETTKTLKASGQKFAKQFGCKVSEIQISIVYNDAGSPNYWLYKLIDDGAGGKRWDLIKELKITEII